MSVVSILHGHNPLVQLMHPIALDVEQITVTDRRACRCGFVIRSRSREAGNAAALDHLAVCPAEQA